MKKCLFILLATLLSTSLQAAVVPLDSVFSTTSKTLGADYDSTDTLTFLRGFTHEPLTALALEYARVDLAILWKPTVILYVDGVPVDEKIAHLTLDGNMAFTLNLPYSEAGHTLVLAGTGISRYILENRTVFIHSVTCYTDNSVADIWYFDNPEFQHDSCRHELSAAQSKFYQRWRAHRIFTPGAWEAFCLPLPPDRVYTCEDNGEEVDLIPSTYATPDGHYWIRSFRDPCPESQVGSNWSVPDALTLPEAGVGYILMLPDDPWWQGREICFEGAFPSGDGTLPLSDDYDESAARAATHPGDFIYLPNTTFCAQTVGEGWLPNVAETQGRYFDNHHDPYTLHPMECHLIGGTATRGLARIGARNVSTDIDESSFSFSSKFLRNGHIQILRNAHTYDLLGRSVSDNFPCP